MLTALKWITGIVAGLIVLVATAAVLIEWSWLRDLAAKTPITINGYLARPGVGLTTAPLAARAAGALALGALLTPLASILAFIEPGLEEDSDCAALIRDSKGGTE